MKTLLYVAAVGFACIGIVFPPLLLLALLFGGLGAIVSNTAATRAALAPAAPNAPRRYSLAVGGTITAAVLLAKLAEVAGLF